MDENENTIEWKVRGLCSEFRRFRTLIIYQEPTTKVLVELMLGGVIEEFNVGYGCLRFECFELWSRNGLGSSIKGRKKSVQRAHWGWCHSWRGVAAVRVRGHRQWRQSRARVVLHSHILTAKSARLSRTAIIEVSAETNVPTLYQEESKYIVELKRPTNLPRNDPSHDLIQNMSSCHTASGRKLVSLEAML